MKKKKVGGLCMLRLPKQRFKGHEIMEMKRRQCFADEHSSCNTDLLSERAGM